MLNKFIAIYKKKKIMKKAFHLNEVLIQLQNQTYHFLYLFF